MSSKSQLTIFTGQRAAVRMVGKSWGQQRPSLLDGADWTPNLSSVTLMEFDNLNPALIYTTFDDVTLKLSYPQNNQATVEAILADVNPTSDAFYVNPAQMVPFQTYANLHGLDGNIKGSWLVRDCTPGGNPFTGTVKEGAKRTLDAKGLQAMYFHGVAIAYTRFRGATTQQAAPVAPGLAQAASGGFLGADTYYLVLTAVTAAGETTPGPEGSIQVVSGSVNDLTVTTPAIAGPITSYNIYMSNRSGGWRFAANVASGTTTTITTLPGVTAVSPPTVNSSGVPSVANDVQLSVSGGIGSGLLSVAAIQLAQTSRPYVMVRKNGVTIATIDNPATEDTFSISADGTTFSVFDANELTDWFDVFTLYKPNPA